MTCPVCGTVPVPGARFCHGCGSALATAATLPAAERRIVTVLFGDLSDFTAWAEDVDPERVGAVTDRVLAALAGAVKTFGGHVDKLTGDGIMAVFGAPVAHEDDAERAVRAALSMQRAVRRVLDDERGGGAPLGLRVGLNTGAVVACVQAAIEYTVIGDTVNTAARLADAAAIGTVYAGSGTATATRHVASWRRLRPLRLKGKREPVESHELLGLRDSPGTRAGLGDEAPFVGRETELGWVAGRLAEVVDRSEPRVLVFTGEAGLGKTRFAAEVERFAAGYSAGYSGGSATFTQAGFTSAVGARVLSVRCVAYGERRRMAPLADLARRAIGLSGDSATTREHAEERLRRLDQRVGRSGRGNQRLDHSPRLSIDILLSLLGYTDATAPAPPAERGAWTAYTSGREGSGGAADNLDVDAIPAAVAELLSVLATEEPLLLAVDDLHDATPETIDTLGAMLSRLAGPVLVVLFGRPELVRTAGLLTGLADAEVTTLPPLRGADAARLLNAHLAGGRLSQSDEDTLLSTAQGNPFYLAELITLLRERGALTSAPAADGALLWRLAPASLGGRLLSRDLAAVLAARIDALPVGSRAVLRDAAVVGDTVPAGALEALRNGRSGRDSRPAAVAAVELERAIGELLQRRMLRRVHESYAFATPLLREAAYAGIGKADLAERHASLARWAAPAESAAMVPAARERPDRVGMTADVADEFVADHAERAAALADAVGLRPEAAARAVAPLGVSALSRLTHQTLAAGEPGQAARYAERATAMSGGALSPSDRLQYARALLQLGRVAEALAYSEKVCANAADGALRASALLLTGRAYQVMGDQRRAYGTWQEALEAATAADRPAERAEAMRRMGMADYLNGRLAEAASGFAAAYHVALAAGDRHSQAWSLQNLAWVTTSRGDFAGADAALGRAARGFAELGDPVGRAWLRGTTAFVRMLAGRLSEARRLALAFLPFGERVGEAWAVGTLRAVEAYAAAELGDLDQADRAARQAYREFATDDDWGRGLALVVRGVVARGLSQPHHAVDLLSDALRYAEKAGHPLLVGMGRTIRGLIRVDLGDAAGAEADARAVLAVVEPHDVLEAAQVGPTVLLALARQCAGDLDAAVSLLAEVAGADQAPALLFPRRQAVAAYASVLLAAGRIPEAVDTARRAVAVPGEDARSRVYAGSILARTLAAAGHRDDAVAVASGAVRQAYTTQQVSERVAAEAVLAEVSS